jgi:hypothetical protein
MQLLNGTRQKVNNGHEGGDAFVSLYIPPGWRTLPPDALQDLVNAVHQAVAGRRLTTGERRRVERLHIRLAKLNRAAKLNEAACPNDPASIQTKLIAEVHAWREHKGGRRPALTPSRP